MSERDDNDESRSVVIGWFVPIGAVAFGALGIMLLAKPSDDWQVTMRGWVLVALSCAFIVRMVMAYKDDGEPRRRKAPAENPLLREGAAALPVLAGDLESDDVDERVEALSLLNALGRTNPDVRAEVVDMWRAFLVRADTDEDVEVMRAEADRGLAQRLLLRRTRDHRDESSDVRGSWAAYLDRIELHNVTFVDADFSGRPYAILDFEGARFVGDTSFRSTRFNRGANFDEARFVGPVDFGKARFRDEVSFDGAEFHDGADFTGARFRSTADFEAAVVTGDLVFDGARFTGAARFTDLSLNDDVSPIFTDATAFIPIDSGPRHDLPPGWEVSGTTPGEWHPIRREP